VEPRKDEEKLGLNWVCRSLSICRHNIRERSLHVVPHTRGCFVCDFDT
jgi:hypothetical protein